MEHPSIRSRVFYAIRHRDVELAENFAARCGEVKDVVDLNTFFHHILSQYPQNTMALRAALDDTMSLDEWLRTFDREILPFLRQNRFPPVTSQNPVSPYAPTTGGK